MESEDAKIITDILNDGLEMAGRGKRVSYVIDLLYKGKAKAIEISFAPYVGDDKH